MAALVLRTVRNTLRFGGMPGITLRVAPMDRRGILLEPLIDEKTSVFDLNGACVGIYRADWRDEGTVCTKLAEQKYGSVKAVAEDCKHLHNRRHSKER